MNNQEAIEEFKKANEILRGGDNGSIRIAKTIVRNDLAIAALEAQQADMWIPVTSGKVPDNYTQVYVTTSTGGPFHLFYSNNEYRFGNYSGDPIIGTVIAWMPFYIPEPWKEEQP